MKSSQVEPSSKETGVLIGRERDTKDVRAQRKDQVREQLEATGPHHFSN